MIVFIRFDKASQPIVHEDVKNTYQKGDLFCVALNSGVIYKYPIINIFDIREK